MRGARMPSGEGSNLPSSQSPPSALPARASVAAAGQTSALACGLVAIGAAPDSAGRYAQAQAEAIRLAAPVIAWTVMAIVLAYVVAQLWFRPTEVYAVWPAYVVQLLAPAFFLLAMRFAPVQSHVETAFLAADVAFTTALALQILSPETAVSGIAGFLAVKVMATALFVPWRARHQYASVAYALGVYIVALWFSPHVQHEPHRLHLYAIPAVAALLSALGTARAARLRQTLLEQTAERETAVGRLQLVLDRMPVGCIVTDAAMRYTYWNKAAERIFGHRQEEVLGKSAVEVITPPHLREWSRRGLTELASRDASGPMRLENITKDGRTIVCEWSAAALRNPDGSLAGTLSMCQDVTAEHQEQEARRKVLAELQEMDRMRAAFVATLSHELRSPINVILGYYDLLLEGVFGPVSHPQREVLGRIGQAAQQLMELVTSTLEVSRAEAGRAVLNLQMVHVQALLEEVRAETLEIQGKAGVAVHWEATGSLPVLYTDPAKLKVIVKNLLSNALKYTERGSVRVMATDSDKGVEIHVADTGLGIPADALPHIFEPFRQFHPQTKETAGGTGLGLYLVRLFAELIGAEVTVTSEVGKGSTFIVKVPLQPPGTVVKPPV